MLPETKFFKLINKSFLSDILQEGVTEFRVSTGSKQGDNVASSLIAIDAKTTSSKIVHIIIKTPPYDNPSQFTYVKRFRIFELENQFYRVLIPQLKELHLNRSRRSSIIKPKLNNVGRAPGEKEFELPVPKYYGGTLEYIALGDVRPAGFKMADKMTGLKLDEVKLVMENLGKFHATTYAFLRHKGEHFFTEGDNYLFLNMITNNVHCPENNEMESNAFTQVYTICCDILSARNPTLGAKTLKLAEKSHELMVGIYKKTDSKYFPIISHGDIWVNNVIFQYGKGYDGNGHETEVAQDVIFLDFQQARRENIFWDLLYFMFTSTTPEFRKESLETSLMVYYDNFVGTCDMLKTSPPIGFSRGWLLDEFYANLPSIWAFMGFAIALQLGDYTTLGLASPKPVDYDNSEASLIPIEQSVSGLLDVVSTLMKWSPAALDRFEAIAKELDEMKIFDKF